MELLKSIWSKISDVYMERPKLKVIFIIVDVKIQSLEVEVYKNEPANKLVIAWSFKM